MEILHASSVTSTSDLVSHLLSANDSEILVYADKQTAGRGTNGRIWESIPGNLHMSFSARYDKPDPKMLSYITCCSVHETIQYFLGGSVHVGVKHPNDITVGGKKISGILIEHFSGSRYIIGVGVNLSYAPIPSSTCISDISKQGLDERQFIEKFLSFFYTASAMQEETIKHYYYKYLA